MNKLISTIYIMVKVKEYNDEKVKYYDLVLSNDRRLFKHWGNTHEPRFIFYW